MHRFLVTQGALTSDAVPIGPADSRHAAVVLRLRPGDPCELLDGHGVVASASIDSVARDAVVARVHERRVRPRPIPEVGLVAALIKGKAWDWTLQKSTEVGVARIVPVVARRSVVRPAPHDFDRRLAEWTRTMGEAAKQCGTPWLPEVSLPTDLASWLRPLPPDELGMVAALDGERRTILHATAASRGIRRAWVAIGPEGDWDPAELALFDAAGYQTVTLGENVLRAETASVAAVVLARAGLVANP
jgi:16S rRNA (uracil1498-N3)-methyltransferase